MIEREFALPEEVKLAKDMYSSDEIHIDDPAPVVRSDAGIWVQAWVFVSNESLHTASDFMGLE